MGPGNQDRVSPLLWRVLVGVESGILGGLVMLAWLSLSSLVDLHSVWIVPNFLGSALLYGQPGLFSGFGWMTVAGSGLHLFVAGSIGALFGLAVGDFRNRLRVILLGVVAGLVWYYVGQTILRVRLGVLSGVYGPPRAMLLGHLLFGLVLGRFPSRLSSLERAFSGESAVPAESHETAATPGAVE